MSNWYRCRSFLSRTYRYYSPGKHRRLVAWASQHGALPAAAVEELVTQQIIAALSAPHLVQAVWDRIRESHPGLTEPEVVLPMRNLAGLWHQLFHGRTVPTGAAADRAGGDGRRWPGNHLEKTATPALTPGAATSLSESLTVQVVPFQYRAPILCSQYTISLDQTLSVRRATEASRTSVKPVVHSIYQRETLEVPASGTYSATTNAYMPNPGFVGTDSFKIRINDGSGEQDVTIVLKVI